MRISVFGLGYVGSVSAACLSSAGHHVIGVDVEPQKLALIRQGRSPVTEPGLDELLGKGVATGQLRVTDDTKNAVCDSDLSLVCVGTPSRRNGSVESTFLERVIQQIGEALAGSSSYHVVAVRSTLLPGVLESRLIPLLQQSSGRTVGSEIGVCVNPEFLREGSALRDFQRPPFTVIGEMDPRAGDVLLSAYAHLQAPVHRVRPDEASMLKYASNAFHAVKVAFANEVGAMSQQLGVDGRKVMKIFCEDRDLNVSSRYLQPGYGFGGSCLPKDLRALNYVAKELDLGTPLLSSVIASNDAHIRRVVDAVLDTGKRRVAMLGLSFKNGSDDLRESPFVTLAESLIGKGLALRICDPDVALGQLIGRNRAYIEERLPHVAQLMVHDWKETVLTSEVVIIAKRPEDVDSLAQSLHKDQIVFDLVGIDALGAALRPWSGDAGTPGRRRAEPLRSPSVGA
jgi:GDP-mannose 6-dehydrogenase